MHHISYRSQCKHPKTAAHTNTSRGFLLTTNDNWTPRVQSPGRVVAFFRAGPNTHALELALPGDLGLYP